MSKLVPNEVLYQNKIKTMTLKKIIYMPSYTGCVRQW